MALSAKAVYVSIKRKQILPVHYSISLPLKNYYMPATVLCALNELLLRCHATLRRCVPLAPRHR